ncbi:MAG: RNA polymerase sigma factor [Gemmatimonadaceae bacterium]
MTDHQPASQSLDGLLAAVQRGADVAAWRALVARLTPRLYRVVRGLTAWRVLGAQTIVEHAWRAAIRAPDALEDGAMLRRRLLTEVVGRALALGDSPRDRADGDSPARLAAMRAVALLPQPARAVLVLADVGGVPLAEVATLLLLPEARLKAELWHARLAVDTLRGAGVDGTPTPPLLTAVDSVPASGGDAADDCAGVAPLWCEPVPDEFIDRLAHDLHDRRQRGRQAPRLEGRRLPPVLGGLLGIILFAAAAAIRPDEPRLAENVPAATEPAVPARADSVRHDDVPVRPQSPMAPDVGERVANRRGDRRRPHAG